MRLDFVGVASIATVLIVSGLARASTKSPSCIIPTTLERKIASNYPGERLVALSDLGDEQKKYFKLEHPSACPGIVRLDFYGDGKPTFALALASTTATKLVIAHYSKEEWSLELLEKTDGAPSYPIIWRQGPGKYTDVYGEKTIRARHPVIVFCGYESWAILYSWTGTTVSKIWLAD